MNFFLLAKMKVLEARQAFLSDYEVQLLLQEQKHQRDNGLLVLPDDDSWGKVSTLGNSRGHTKENILTIEFEV